MSIGKKLNLIFIVFVLLLFVSTVISYASLNKIEDKNSEALEYRVEQIRTVDNIRYAIGMEGLYARAVLLDGSEESKANLTSYESLLDEYSEK